MAAVSGTPTIRVIGTPGEASPLATSTPISEVRLAGSEVSSGSGVARLTVDDTFPPVGTPQRGEMLRLQSALSPAARASLAEAAPAIGPRQRLAFESADADEPDPAAGGPSSSAAAACPPAPGDENVEPALPLVLVDVDQPEAAVDKEYEAGALEGRAWLNLAPPASFKAAERSGRATAPFLIHRETVYITRELYTFVTPPTPEERAAGVTEPLVDHALALREMEETEWNVAFPADLAADLDRYDRVLAAFAALYVAPAPLGGGPPPRLELFSSDDADAPYVALTAADLEPRDVAQIRRYLRFKSERAQKKRDLRYRRNNPLNLKFCRACGYWADGEFGGRPYERGEEEMDEFRVRKFDAFVAAAEPRVLAGVASEFEQAMVVLNDQYEQELHDTADALDLIRAVNRAARRARANARLPALATPKERAALRARLRLWKTDPLRMFEGAPDMYEYERAGRSDDRVRDAMRVAFLATAYYLRRVAPADPDSGVVLAAWDRLERTHAVDRPWSMPAYRRRLEAEAFLPPRVRRANRAIDVLNAAVRDARAELPDGRAVFPSSLYLPPIDVDPAELVLRAYGGASASLTPRELRTLSTYDALVVVIAALAARGVRNPRLDRAAADDAWWGRRRLEFRARARALAARAHPRPRAVAYADSFMSSPLLVQRVSRG